MNNTEKTLEIIYFKHIKKLRHLLIILTLSIILNLSFVKEKYVSETLIDDNSGKIEIYECKYGQCYAIAKSTSKRCKHCVSNEGDTYCWQHED